MKKVCSTQKVNNLKGRSFPYRSPLLKAVSLGTAMTALLSSVSPVVAANFSPTEMVASNLKGTKNPNRISLNATYGNSKSHGSIAVGDRYHTADDIVISHLLNSDDIVISYLLNSKTISVERISEKKYEQLHTPHSSVDFTQKNLAIQSATWSADGRNAMPNVGHFYLSRNNPLTLKLNNNDTPEECKKQPDLIGCNISGLAWDGRSAAEGGNCVDYKICSKHSGIEIFNSFNEEGAIIINSTFGPGGVNGTFGKGAKAAEGAVAMGQQIGGRDGDNPYALYRGAQALGRGSIAIGNGSAVGVNTQASIAIGIKAQVGGHSARDGVAKDGIAIGKSAISNGDLALALGAHAKVIVDEGVALGAYSVADVPGGIAGYDPGNIKPSVHSETWKSSAGAVSVGTNYLAERRVVTRQIVNLAAGTQDTDAVNVAQLKSLKKWVEDNNAGGKGWKLSVNGANATDVASESTVDFSSTGNLKITKDPKNKVTFDLAQKITVNEIKMGNGDNAILTPEALQFKGGSSIGSNGIHAGNKKIMGLADGILDDDAVNKKQLDKVSDFAKKGWVLTLNDGKPIQVASGSQIGFLSRGGNLTIKNDGTGNILFSLTKDITVDSITAGGHILNGNGLQIKDNGPGILTSGINAGDKKITGVLAGALETDAVNFGQLKALKDELEKNDWIQQDSETKKIKIGAKAEGAEISFLNKESKERTLSGLKDGTISATSTEAITGKQLYGVDKKLSDVSTNVDDLSVRVAQSKVDIEKIGKNTSTYLGGGADLVAGKVPTYKIQEKSYNNVGAAFIGVDGSITDLYSKLASVAGDSLVQQEASETKDGNGRITIGAKVGGTEINLLNKESKERTLSGLKDGTVSATSTEAITGKQLYDVDKKLSEYLGGGVDLVAGKAPTYKIQDESYNNVGAAFAGIDGSLSDIYKELSGVGGKSLVQQEASGDGNGRITVGAKTGGTEISLLNKESGERTLSGLKDGTISATSTEAITGKQLYGVDKKLSDVSTNVDDLSVRVAQSKVDIEKIGKNTSTYLGGGADLVAGKVPTYKIQEKSYNNVGAAFIGVDGSITDLYSKLASVAGDSLVQQEASETKDGNGRITIGAKVGGTKISLLNKESKERTLSGLKDGTVSTISTEAITGKQLYETNSKVAEYFGGNANYKDGEWTDPTFTVNVLKEDGSTEQKKYKNVANALEGLSSSFTTVVENNLVQQEKSETKDGNGRITIGAKTGGTEISLLNKESGERTLSGLKDGTISATSTEAITGKQLYGVDKKLSDVSTNVDDLSVRVAQSKVDIEKIGKNTSTYLGGGADLVAGKVPTYKIQEKSYNNVGAAFIGVDGSITDLYSKLASVAGDSLVQQEASETKDGNGRITIGAKVGGTKISLLNKESKERTLSGLKDGTVSTISTEAITGKQLYETNSKVAEYFGGNASYKDGEWTDPTFTINVLKEDGSTEQKKYKNVADALNDVSGSLTTVVENTLIQQEESEDDSGRITIGAKVGGTEISLLNKESGGRTLSGLKDGTVSSISTEAITGKQLYETNSKVAEYFGGNANYKDGEWTDPTFTVNVLKEDGSTEQKKYKNVANALEGLSSSFTTVVENNLVQQEKSETKDGNGRITIGAKTGGTEINLLNKDSKERTLSGLKDGTISATSTEAITGKQLYGVDKKLSDVSTNVDDLSVRVAQSKVDIEKIGKNTSTYLGGGADLVAGKVPTYKIQEKSYNNVGAAFAGIDGSLSDIYKELSGVGGKSLVQQEASGDGNGRITIGAKTGGTEISLLNKESGERTLSGLKDGTVSTISTEAITGKQLYETNSKVAEYFGGNASYKDGEWTDPTFTINVLKEDGSTEQKKYKNVADALNDVSGSLTTVVENTLIQQEESEDDSGRITIGAKVGGTEISLLNKESGGRTLSGLKDGTVSSISTEAITGKQLYETNSKVAEYFGGNANYKDGKWTDPTFTVNVLKEDGSTEQKKYKNVANALEGLSSSFTTVVENNLVQQEKSETKDGNGRITIGAKTGGTEINLLNKDSKERTLSGLKDGTISATSTEAITGKQLYGVDKKLSDVSTNVDDLSVRVAQSKVDIEKIGKNTSTYLGGGADLVAGKVPTYKIQEKSYNNVGAAFAGIDGSLSDIYKELSGVGGKSLVQQEASGDGSGRITVGAKTGGTKISLLNKESQERTLSGLKDGTVSTISTEAITGKQLYETNSKVAEYFGGNANYKDGEWTDPTFTVNVLKEDGSTEQKKYKNVANALEGLSSSFTTVVENNLVQQEKSETKDGNGRITIGAKTGGTEINLLNKESKERTLSGLKDGTISSTSTEAITGKQLYGVDKKLSDVSTNVDDLSVRVAQSKVDIEKIGKNTSTYLGGGADLVAGKSPTYKIQEKSYNNVGAAFAGIDGSLSDIYNELSGVGGKSLVQQEASGDGSGRITVGAKTGGTEISLLNKESGERTLSGLKDGKVSEKSTEAVTGKQLFAVEGKLTDTNNKLTVTDNKVSELNKDVTQVKTDVSTVKTDLSKFGTNISSYLGGGADLVAGKSPTYKIQDESYNNVGAAFAGIDGSLSDIYKELSGVGGKSLVQQEASGDGSGRITVGAKTGGTEISLLNKESGERTLSGLKDGKVSEKSTEAVTGKQLFAVEGKLTDTNNKLTVTDNKVSELNKDVTQVKTDVSTVKTDLSKFGTNISSYLGGGADLVAGKAPTYKIQDESYNSVGATFAGIDGSLSDIYNELSGAGTKGLVQQEVSGRITIGAKTGGTEISLLNKESGERTLSGLKDGKVSEKSTEAVTGKQLFSVEGKLTDTNNKLTVTDNKVSELDKNVTQVKTDVSTVKTDLSKFGTNISSYLGGGADLVAGKAPTYKIQDESYNSVGATFAGIDGSLSDIYNELSGAGTKGLVQQEVSGRITIGAKTGGTEISLLNKESGERTLSGLKDGKVSEKSTEAVTGKQLFAVEGKLTDTNNKLTVTDNKVSELDKNVTQVKTDVSTVKTDLSKFGTNISSYLGGGADLVAGKAPTYKIQDESYNSVGAAFAGIDGSLSDIYNELSGAGTKGLVQQEASGRITIGAKTGGTEISLLNKESGERTLSGLKDGTISSTSTEAITGKQLYGVDKKLSDVSTNVDDLSVRVAQSKVDIEKIGKNTSTYLGGGADLVAGKSPTYKIQEKSYNNVGAAFAGIDGSLSDIYNELSGVGGKSLVQQEASGDGSGRITVGAKTGGTEISLLNKESGERTLSGLKDGKVSEKSTEAVTGKQLFAVEGKLTDTNNKLTVTDNKVSELNKDVTQVKTDVSTVKTDLSKFGTNISSYLGVEQIL
ncbi:MAG: hypothetical protein PG977_000026 [Bartonella clarridgeiae]|uniref:hypothetical protein n=1 Tax=Bartonella clarridgeiae TaxID=56426 RepID=UPI0023F0DD19|nr:hypothetical protein [Bartonella clarridgeiae]WCR54633.1 MAG: hypothetical protein PG977_000026 [Bartonella clarridgeiae]